MPGINRLRIPNVIENFKIKCPGRRHEVVLHRLRLGRAILGDYLFLINGRDTDLCSTCLVSETVEHVLLHCQKYDVERNVLKNKLKMPNLSLKRLFHTDETTVKILSCFIQEAGLFMKL